MAMEKRYWCNICGDNVTWHSGEPMKELRGIRFIGNHDFQITDHRKTDGRHICTRCLDQISEQWTKNDQAD